ncbi:hypothetical protein ACVWY2_001950 [Bradyrhizobium sp. JR6.1]
MTPLLWTLVAIQIAMGAFDTFYHHEFTERLAWRPSQRHELQLHSVRNMLYALLFLALGWLQVHGILAIGIMAVLVVEVVITLMDFVEEDLSRKLPPSERINHTLLAINYGAILVLLVPVLIGWAMLPTAVVPAYAGLLSLFATAAAFGAALFGARDFAAARRLGRMVSGPAATLVEKLPARQTVLITGATGFVGSRLAASLTASGHHVIALIRNPAKAEMLPPPVTLITSLDQLPADTGIDAVVNLAGEPIGNGLWTEAKRRKIIASRVDMTAEVVRLIARLERKPSVLVSGSAIGWYGLWQDQVLTESAKPHACFSHELCEAWENAAKPAAGQRRARRVFADRSRGRHRRRFHHADADALRIWSRRPARLGQAVDVMDRARRSGAPDRACDREAGALRPDQRHRADPGDQHEVHRGARTPPAPARDLPRACRAAPRRRRRLRQRAAARRPACAAEQGAQQRLCVPA